MKNIITLVALVLSLFSSIQTAWANSVDTILDSAVEATVDGAKADAEKAAKEFRTTRGKIIVNRDNSVTIVPNGPTIGQRIYLAGAEVKKGVLYVTYKTYEGAKAADGAVVGTVTYPFAVIGDWMKTKPEVKEVAAVTPDAPAAK